MPASAGPDPLIGAELAGRYVIEALVGEGSMGMIYRARHVRLPRHFAVKILFGDLVADPRMRIRFAQEAALASRLSHPHVVSVVDFGRSEAGLLYLVMNYVEGETLAELIAREAPLDTARAIRLTRELAQGLAHAHENGLVHRDFKPGNVVLERQESGPPIPRILDFGLAISTSDREESHGAGELAGRLTECGLIVGTPIYIAPEQALDHPVDHRADLFALGVVLYEMLAGKPPFDGSPVEIAHKNVTEPVPPISRRSPGLAVPAELEQVVRRLVAKSPDDRFASAAELCSALDDVEQGRASGRTIGMKPLIYGGPDVSGELDESELAIVRPRRKKVGAIGVLLFAAGAVAYGAADHAGLIGIGQLELEAPVSTASAAVETPAPSPAMLGAVGPRSGPALAAAVPLTGAAADRAEDDADEPVSAGRARSARRGEHRKSARHRADRSEESVADTDEDVAGESYQAFRVDEDPPSMESEPESTPMVESLPGETAPPADAATTPPADTGAPPPADTAIAAIAGAPVERPAFAPREPTSVDRLIRDYREVGEAIAALEARGGERAARRLRERYFRLPYGDALRIPAVRRDTLQQLGSLRHDVTNAAEDLPPRSTTVSSR